MKIILGPKKLEQNNKEKQENKKLIIKTEIVKIKEKKRAKAQAAATKHAEQAVLKKEESKVTTTPTEEAAPQPIDNIIVQQHFESQQVEQTPAIDVNVETVDIIEEDVKVQKKPTTPIKKSVKPNTRKK